MNKTLFQQYAAANYNRIPLSRELLADLDTPLSAYLKLAHGPYSYLLESVQGGETWGRYSIIGLPCRTVVRVSGTKIDVWESGQLVSSTESPDPLQWVEDYRQQYRVPIIPGSPRFAGGLVGYFGYEVIRYVEPKLHRNKQHDRLNTPDILLMVSEELVIFDNLKGKLLLIVHADPAQADAWEQAQSRLSQLGDQLQNALVRGGRQSGHGHIVREQDFISDYRAEEYQRGVCRIKEYIAAGDAMQVVLSQRMSVPVQAAPLDIYRTLRSLNPSPYMYYMDCQDFHVVGSSPEILVRLEESLVTVRPLAGTRRRGVTPQEDKALELELLSDPKELAEHLMLIDLGRNDVGRVAEVGSVKLTEKMLVERYSHVMHIVSNVTARLKPGFSPLDVLKATFPAGTVSGAPKIRAMEILDELEPTKRGIYAGAVGYISWSGNMDTAIAIRTAVIKDGILYLQAGAGIVADSDPAQEWQETLDKGRAIFRAVAQAEAGLTPGPD